MISQAAAATKEKIKKSKGPFPGIPLRSQDDFRTIQPLTGRRPSQASREEAAKRDSEKSSATQQEPGAEVGHQPGKEPNEKGEKAEKENEEKEKESEEQEKKRKEDARWQMTQTAEVMPLPQIVVTGERRTVSMEDLDNGAEDRQNNSEPEEEKPPEQALVELIDKKSKKNAPDGRR